MSANDSVPIGGLGDAGPPPSSQRYGAASLKLLVALFLVFVTVVSDGFTNSVIAGFGENAVRGRTATPWGVVLQGVCLVIFYALAVYLFEHQVL
jgi:protein-S-isoprenylcysteine O-methyltransferase Ste14